VGGETENPRQTACTGSEGGWAVVQEVSTPKHQGAVDNTEPQTVGSLCLLRDYTEQQKSQCLLRTGKTYMVQVAKPTLSYGSPQLGYLQPITHSVSP
jgi:hypothetical protein